MAYMRGNIYIWYDESGTHLWNRDGYDGWDQTGWHEDVEGQIDPNHQKDGVIAASGVSIPQDVMDEYVVMRLAELLEEGELEHVIDRSLSNWERASLERNAAALKSVLRKASEVREEPVDKE